MSRRRGRPGVRVGIMLMLILAGPAAPDALGSGLAAQLSADSTTTGRVEGRVVGRFQDRSGPLPFATVEAWASTRRLTAVADSLGRYTLQGVPPGMIRLRVSHAGHADAVLDVWVPRGGPARVDVELRGRPLVLPGVEVVSGHSPSTTDPDGRGEGGLPQVETAALQGGPGMAGNGVAEAVAGLPGQDPARSTDVLLLRGSSTDRTRVVLDGAPVFTPFHVAGLLPGFQPAALGSAQLHMGGAPARFDGGLTYILDLRTRSPGTDVFRGSGSVDLLSANATVDGPLGGGVGMLASARALHDLASGPLGSSPYSYGDALVSLTARLGPDQRVKATGFWNREGVRLDLGTGRPPGEEAWWSNAALSAAFHGRVGRLFTEVVVAGSGYRAALPLRPSSTREVPDPDPLLAEVETGRVRTTLDVALPIGAGMVRAGVNGERLESLYGARTRGPGGASHASRSQAWSAGGYLDLSRRVAPEVTVRGGLRLDGFSSPAGGLRLAPRASLAWTFAPSAVLTLAAGRYHQYARAPRTGAEQTLAEVVDPVVAASAPLTLATADHFVATLDQELGSRTRLTLDGFWKGFSGLGGDEDRLRSSGVDVRVHRSGDEVQLWAGYGLSWFWSGDPGGSSDSFTGRHLLSAGMDSRLAGPVGMKLRLAYGAGLPYTSVPFSTSEPGAAAEDGGLEVFGARGDTAPGRTVSGGVQDAFLRLDVELNAELTPSVAGRNWHVRPYLRLLNALDRRDALFYAFQRGEEPSALAERSLIPVLGVSWRF